jgi:tetrahydromethanopterin S-methyltransferase subunit G
MTIQEAITFLQKQRDNSQKKAAKKRYEKYLYLLNALDSREFTGEELERLESELEKLRGSENADNTTGYLKKALPKFENYLVENFSLVSKEYFTNLGIVYGSAAGLLFGIFIQSAFHQDLGITFGLIAGTLIGLLVGHFLDEQAKREGRVL